MKLHLLQVILEGPQLDLKKKTILEVPFFINSSEINVHFNVPKFNSYDRSSTLIL